MNMRCCRRCQKDQNVECFLRLGHEHQGICQSCVDADEQITDTKTCARCRLDKTLKHFNKQGTGRGAWCKPCTVRYKKDLGLRPPAHTPTSKKCRACRRTKLIGQFYTRKGAPDGHHAQCRDCMLESGKTARSRVALTTAWGDVKANAFRRWMSKYSLSRAELTSLLSQPRCGICEEPFSPQRPGHIDHDHRTGLVRSLLCLHCNLILGHAKDAPRVLRNAYRYINQHGHSDMNKRLTSEQAQAVIRRVAAGEKQKVLAEEHGVSAGTISNLVNGKSWPDLERPEVTTVVLRGCKLKAIDIPVILARLAAREKPGDISPDYNVTRQAIADIGSGKTWSHIARPTPQRPVRRRVWEG